MPFLPPDCTWRCLIRASAMRGGMVGQNAPSRPIRVTVPFAGAPYHRTTRFPSRSEMRVQLAACMARPWPGWKAAQKIQCDRRAGARRSGLAGGFGQAKRPGLFLGRATARPSRGPPVPRINQKMLRPKGHPHLPRLVPRLVQTWPPPLCSGFSSCPVPPLPSPGGSPAREQRASRFSLAGPPRFSKEGTARPPPQNGGHKWQPIAFNPRRWFTRRASLHGQSTATPFPATARPWFR